MDNECLQIRGEPERAPNTRGTGSGFICIYIYIYMYVCGVVISVRRELNLLRVGNGRQAHARTFTLHTRSEW